MRIFLINKKTVKYTYFNVYLVDATLKLKIDKERYPYIYSFLRYPTKTYLKLIRYMDEFADTLYYVCGESISGVSTGREFLFNLNVKFI